ncbi:MAG: IS630 family transposase [Terracidiphilus sp.]
MLPSKKTPHASEQEREDAQQARRAWIEALPTMNVEKLVFIDETWTTTNMTRRCGRAPRGKRCIGSAPHGHWKTTTFAGALRRRQLSAPMVIDEPMDGEMFLAYVRKFLCPTLRPGDIVILDNLSSHKVTGVEEAITATGATVLYLPPYSPDFNSIEKFFSKLKALLRKASKRSTDELWKEIGRLLDGVTQSECENYIINATLPANMGRLRRTI